MIPIISIVAGVLGMFITLTITHIIWSIKHHLWKEEKRREIRAMFGGYQMRTSVWLKAGGK